MLHSTNHARGLKKRKQPWKLENLEGLGQENLNPVARVLINTCPLQLSLVESQGHTMKFGLISNVVGNAYLP